MEEYIVYIDVNGFKYVKGDIGGGYTINWNGGYFKIDGNTKLWDYCTEVTEEQILHFCKKTDERIEL